MGERVVWFVAGLVAAGASSAQMRTMPVKEASHFKLVTVADGVYAAVAKAGDRSAVGNAGFIAGKDGVVVVPAHARDRVPVASGRNCWKRLPKASPALL